MSRSLRRRVSALEAVTEFEQTASRYDPDVLRRMTDDELIEVSGIEDAFPSGDFPVHLRERLDEIIRLAGARDP